MYADFFVMQVYHWVIFTRIFFSSLLLWEFIFDKIYKGDLVVKFSCQMSSCISRLLKDPTYRNEEMMNFKCL